MTSSSQPLQPIRFVKAHGTGNDFIVLNAVEQDIDLDANQVAMLCDRHKGIGADGLLRIAPARDFGVVDAKFFMDYRNSDGSIAETCGNGLRVFARILIEQGYETFGVFKIGTRAGTVTAAVNAQDVHFKDISIRIGQPNMDFSHEEVSFTTKSGTYSGRPVFMPNPHCVTIVEDVALVGDLIEAPILQPNRRFPNGANIEFISSHSEAHITMRTHERGVGETLSCGSGACAAASVWATRLDMVAPWTIQVDVLGGTVYVDCDELGFLTLRGPAQVIAAGTVQSDLWMS